MHNSRDLSKEINRFINGQLSDEELVDFLKKVEERPELKDEIAFQSLTMNAGKELEVERFIDILRNTWEDCEGEEDFSL